MTISEKTEIIKTNEQTLPFPADSVFYHNMNHDLWPKELRLYVTEKCNFKCSFPCGTLWCHETSDLSNNRLDGSLKDFLTVADSFHSSLGFTKVKIAGMEPTLWKPLRTLVQGLQDIGYCDISLTTNGYHLRKYLPGLIRCGLNRLTVSLHSLQQQIFKQISCTGQLNKVTDSLSLAKDFSLPTKINHVLIRGVNTNIRPFLNYCHKNCFEPKLYQLIWHPKISRVYNNYFIEVEKVIQSLKLEFSRVEVFNFPLSQRTRYKYYTKDVAPLIFGKFQKKGDSNLPICQKCHFRYQCQEGFMGYGYNVLPNLDFSPCYLRDELSFNLRKKIANKELDDLPEIITSIAGID
ncbi:MAG: radical SAM protein [Candidatus Heimdallarchaeota archaeon]